ncbi:hypothetical protein [Azospirillum sp. SYSU D00513]|uniref:hypothetical protein n=1 Tax=Azospirillum sp. SYSU D00513 TaxID=2812561 RepID=UPI001A9589C9|nr:hypothetical protein [Azospirillum sp. SYSU D00513]
MLTLGIITMLAGRTWLRASVEREHRAFQRELDAIMLGRLELVEAARQSNKK